MQSVTAWNKELVSWQSGSLEPDKEFLSSMKIERLDREENVDGTVPDKRLSFSCKNRIELRKPMMVGSVPVS